MTVTTGGPRRRTAKEEREAARDEVRSGKELEAAMRATIATPTAATPPRLASDYVHTTRPDGVDVVFVPGDALPEWVVLED